MASWTNRAVMLIAGVARASLPLWGVTTQIGLPSVFDQSFQVVFGGDLKPKLTQAVWDALEKKRAEARDLLVVPYEPLSEEQKAQASEPKGRQAAPSTGTQQVEQRSRQAALGNDSF